MTDLTRAWAEQQDAADDLASFRDRVYRPDPDLLYLDGNSLGMLPLSTRERMHQLIDDGWGRDLVRGWQHWDDLPLQAGDRVGALIGAAPGQVVVCDSISVNLYKLAVAALEAQPGRKVLVTDTRQLPHRPLRAAGRRRTTEGAAAPGPDRPGARRQPRQRAHLPGRRRRDGVVLARRLPLGGDQ